MRRRRLLPALAVIAAIGAALAVAQALRAPPAALARARTGRAAVEPDGVQTVAFTVERGEYRPNVVTARAGTALRIRVLVRDRHGCATRLLVPDLGVDLPLVAGGEAVAVVPSARPGSYLFTCEQRMVKGVLVVE